MSQMCWKIINVIKRLSIIIIFKVNFMWIKKLVSVHWAKKLKKEKN